MTTTPEQTSVSHDPDDQSSNSSTATPIGSLIQTRLSRRDWLRGAAAVAMAGSLAPALLRAKGGSDEAAFTFTEIAHDMDPDAHVAPEYRMQVLLRWGDALFPGMKPFDPTQQSAEDQERRFGYNNDYIAFLPLPRGSHNSEHGLLCVNHEYTNPWIMFPGLTAANYRSQMSKEQVEIEMAAHGHAVVEIVKRNGNWVVVLDSEYNRRISLRSTEIEISGPAAGHDSMKTSADPTGTTVIGTMNNCAGGVTPWGTVLMAEENFNLYFGCSSSQKITDPSLRRYGFSVHDGRRLVPHHPRFDLDHEPNEANRFGWMVEFDPYDPQSVPVKRTALGRFKHEGATPVVSSNGQVAVYSGDDQKGDYLYKFVTNGKYNPKQRSANRSLLDQGTLYVAKFYENGKLEWLPLIHNHGPLTSENGFASQADVVIHTRLAADKLGATPLDRPEDVEVHPENGRVYVMLTNNSARGKTDPVDGVNPRANNQHGHVLEIIPPVDLYGNVDHTATHGEWEIFLLAGNPAVEDHHAQYHQDVSENGWFSCPDNAAFDSKGRIWIATDGAPAAAGISDGLYAADTTGSQRALPKRFFRAPLGAEVCGPCFTPDDRNLFLAVQHPGEPSASYDYPVTRWPDFDPKLPPRPAVVVITRKEEADDKQEQNSEGSEGRLG